MGLKICTICGTEYEARGKRFATAKYCSAACCGKGKTTQQERVCRNCHKTFLFKPSQLNKYPNAGRYCSRNCGYAYRVKKNATIPTKDRWGRTKRVADKEWQRKIREQDNSTCRRCGRHDPYIHTHHVATRATRPDLKHDLTNGICLCGSCHSWVHHHPKESVINGWLVSNGSN